MMRKCKVDTDFDRQIREAFKVLARCPAVGVMPISRVNAEESGV